MNERYQRGGDLWQALADQYGEASADYVAQQVAATGSATNALADVRAAARSGKSLQTVAAAVDNLDTGLWSNLGTQLVNDPLAAPLDSLNNQISKAVGNVFKNPMVLLVVIVAGLGLVMYFGGLQSLKRRVTG